MCDNTCNFETCQDYRVKTDDLDLALNICFELKMLKNYITKHYSGQIGNFLDDDTLLIIIVYENIWNNYINRKKWRRGKRIPKIVIRDLALKIKETCMACYLAEFKAIREIMKEKPLFEWNYEDQGDGLPRVKSNEEMIKEVFG